MGSNHIWQRSPIGTNQINYPLLQTFETHELEGVTASMLSKMVTSNALLSHRGWHGIPIECSPLQ